MVLPTLAFSFRSWTTSSRTAAEAHPLLGQDARGDALLLAHQAQEDVLGADVVVEHPLRFFGRVAEHALALDGEGDVDRGRDLVPVERAALDLLADGVHGEMALAEDPRGQTLPLSDEAEQQVLRLDRIAAELARLVAGKENHPPGAFGVALEHGPLASAQAPPQEGGPAVRRLSRADANRSIIAQKDAPHLRPKPRRAQPATSFPPSSRRVAVGGSGQPLVVGDDHHREALLPVETPQQVVKSVPGLPIEVPGRLVGEDGPRAAHQGPGHRDPLLLPSRQGAGTVVAPRGQAQLVEERPRLRAAPRVRGRARSGAASSRSRAR